MSIRVTVDISDERAFYRTARANLHALLPAMLWAVKFAAKYERDTHPYTNRTGDLQAATSGFIHQGGLDSAVTAVLEMGMPYASYVDALGYSNIDEAGNMAAQNIARSIDAIGDAIADGRRVRR